MNWRSLRLRDAVVAGGAARRALERFNSALHWRTMQSVDFEYHVAAFEDAWVNNWFHLLLPTQRAFCSSEQNNRFEKNVPGLVLKDGHHRLPADPDKVDVGGTAFVVGGQQNHWHFQVNFLPRLVVTQKLMPEMLEGVDHVVLHADVSPFQEELLRRLELPAPLVRIDRARERLYRFDEVVYPSLFRNHTLVPRALSLVRERLHELIEDVPREEANAAVLLLRRSRTPRRRIHNEDAVRRVLGAVGVRSFFAEDLDFAHQLAAFRDADLVVAPHGAGLANLLACRPGTDVVIFEYKWPTEMQALALALGLNPRVVLCRQHVDADFERTNPKFQRRLRDLVVNERQLAAEVAQVAYLRGWAYRAEGGTR